MTMAKTSQEVHFDLKRPCDDCPFRTDAKRHDGVIKDLPTLHGRLERGLFAHTCHKTDPRSDGPNPKYKGPVQHCAGALILCRNDKDYKLQHPQIDAALAGKFDPTELDMESPVFKSFHEMVKHYVAIVNEDERRKK